MGSSPEIFRIPDFLSMCEYASSLNPCYKAAGVESLTWFDSFSVLTPRKRTMFIHSNADLLVAYTYPYAGYDEFRTCLDFISLLFALDEITDDQTGTDARLTMASFLNTLAGDPCDGSVISRMTAEAYIDAVCREAELRERGEILGLDEYRLLRRENIALRLCFSLFEYCFGFDLPNEVFADPTFMRMFYGAVDMIALANDVYSYNMEQAREGHSCSNIVTVIMKEKGFSLQRTIDYIGEEFRSLITDFADDKETLRSFGEKVDTDVYLFISALETWIVGNIFWSFSTERYFGKDHEEVRKTLTVRLAKQVGSS
ncbi:hypothetical protein EW145_g1027 [Phellinidium pouzarii]|uniref:Terpene synthase n=1 Tax=Phellinidium pouzarii TaxID=167371 RepID=A0A4S4LHW6_9AGAM|nr:hypothetical protein EW145_g1027 [Phellinidium pouzarii]